MDLLQSISILGLGFLLGLKHALDADHVIAVSTIVSETKSIRKSALIGIFWGFGHSSTLLIVGLVILLFKISIPESVAVSFELLISVMLIWLGFDVLKKVSKNKYHIHQHEHDGTQHTHLHSHKTSALHTHAHKSFGIGMAHGLAGSAALMLIILTAIKSIWQGVFYIIIFGIGSTIGMLIVSGIIGLPFVLSNKLIKMQTGLKWTAGIISIIFGFIIMYDITMAL